MIGPLTRPGKQRRPQDLPQFVALDRGGPAVDTGRRRSAPATPCSRSGIPNIELEHVEDGGEALDRLMRDLFLAEPSCRSVAAPRGRPEDLGA